MAAGDLRTDCGLRLRTNCGSSAVDDVALGVDADLMMHPAHAADFRHVPHFTESFVVAL